MGGQKKLNLKQMERMQDKKDEEGKSKDKDKKKKEKTGAPKEKKPLSILAPEINDKTVGEIKKMHVLTPFSVASRFGIRMSVARSFLRELEEKDKIQLASGNHNIRIYKAN
jgi:small subunit ribosomal protein S25e